MKRFWITGESVGIANDSSSATSFLCSIDEFQVLEPDFVFEAGYNELWTEQKHNLSKDGNSVPAPDTLGSREQYCDRLDDIANRHLAMQPTPEPIPGPQPESPPPDNQPDLWQYLEAFCLEFSLGAMGEGSSLYSSIQQKVRATGDPGAGVGAPNVEEAWQNLRMCVAARDRVGIAAGLQGLKTLLTSAGHPPSLEDADGDEAVGDPYDGWNTLCEMFQLPETVEISGVSIPFRL